MSAPRTQRPLPANQSSERVVLAELLLNNKAWEQGKTLTEDDFSLTSHQRIFACIRSRLSVGRPIDVILLIDAMRRQKELDAMGAAYISDLTDGIEPGICRDGIARCFVAGKGRASAYHWRMSRCLRSSLRRRFFCPDRGEPDKPN